MDAKHVNVVFRFDDYSARSATTLEETIIGLFQQHKAAVTFGVIPFACAGDIHDPAPQDVIPLSTAKAHLLEESFRNGVVDVALHGYSHQTIEPGRYTEFADLDFPSQLERLTKGKQLLEQLLDAPVTTFVPPWNKYDLNTLQALEQLGFSTLSANRRGVASHDSRLNFLPASCSLFQLPEAIVAARNSSDLQPLVVVLFHEYDFKEINQKRGRMTIGEFANLLDWLGTQPDIRLLSISQATQEIQDLSAARYLQNQQSPSLLAASSR